MDWSRLSERAWRELVLTVLGNPRVDPGVRVHLFGEWDAVLFDPDILSPLDLEQPSIDLQPKVLLATRTLPAVAGVQWFGPHDVEARLTAPQRARLEAACGVGDVLGRVAGPLAEDLTQFLEAELLADLYSRLESISSDPERRIPLSRVFVDLPTDARADFCARLTATSPRFHPGDEDVLLVGGPGQGKTTVGQYLCQVHRAFLLQPRADSLGPDAEGQLGPLLRQVEALRPEQLRFPIRVPLHRLAAQMAGGQDPLWDWILARFRLQLEREVDASALRELLARFPLLLVLDGLDEVPASANRDAVVAAIRTFLLKLREAGADVLAVTSTRPQGYRGEFDWKTLTLLPLELDHARTYAERLIRERNRTDKERQAIVRERFERALVDDRTLALSRSPLQVTILCALLERQSAAPPQRWALFRDYFRVIYDRERDRDLPTTRVLGQQEGIVRRLHWEVGYLLHVRSEVSGEDASLSRAEFAEVVERVLAQRTFTGVDSALLRDQLVEAALLRLVFLVGVGDERVGFEIRSLQEFAAAERMVEAEGSVVEERFAAIARPAHWRNVFAFAAGHGETEHEPLVAAILRVLGRFPEEAPVLAAELLAEGVGVSMPARRESLFDTAARGLAGPLAGRIVEVLAREAPDRVSGAPRLSVWAWAAAHAAELEIRVEQLDPDEVPEALKRTQDREADIEAAFWQYPPERWFDEDDEDEGFVCPTALATALDCAPLEGEQVDQGGFSFIYRPLDTNFIPPIVPPGAHPAWEFATAAWRFRANPSPTTLSEALRLARHHPRAAWVLGATLPWVLSSGLQPRRLSSSAKAAEAGEFGEEADWRAAEARWRTDEVNGWPPVRSADSAPFDRAIARVGPPPHCWTSWTGQRATELDADWRQQGGLNPVLNSWMLQSKIPLPDETDHVWDGVSVTGSARLLWRGVRELGWSPRWRELLARAGRANRQNDHYASFAESGVHILPIDDPGLLAFAAATLRSNFPTRILIPANILATIQPPDDRLAADHLLLRLTQPEADPAAEAELRRLLPLVDTLADDLVAASLVVPEPHYDDILRIAISLTTPPARMNLIRALADRIAARPSGLADPERAIALQLPLLPGTTPPPPALPTPERLQRVTLRDFKCHENLEITHPGTGQWTIFLGDNGVGKTSILRAIALTLLPADIAHAFVTFAPAPTIRIGAANAHTQVELNGATWERVLMDGGGASKGPTDLFVVGYGPHRGSVHSGSSEPDFSPRASVNTLFDDGASLTHPERWLEKWSLRAFERRNGDQQFFDALRATLAKLLPGVERIEVSSEGSRVFGPLFPGVPLSALSDGYLTTAAWLLDLVARWVEWARNKNLVISGDFAARMTGLVLIDEIDLHLHPQWQRELIPTLRAHFPNLSFVATTHNPITLLGAEPGEICVLRRTDSGVSADFRDIPRGADADFVLTGDWFGLVSTVDADTLRLLDEQRALLRVDPDTDRVAELRAILRGRLGGRSTSLEHLVESIAAEILEEETASLTAAGLEAARAKILARVRERRGQ